MKIGRPKNFETPEEMLKAFQDYKNHTKLNPRYRYQLSQRTGEMVEEPLQVPLTLEGFNIFCFERYGLVKHYFKNQDNLYNEFIPICSYIREEIRQDQIEGGMVGQYNASITQRLNGLVDKQEVNVSEQPLFLDNKE
jgi:hypothetical protein